MSNVGPGPSATNGTGTADSSNPNATMGTNATSTVRSRLFNPPITLPTLGLAGPEPPPAPRRPRSTVHEFTRGVTRSPTRAGPGGYR
ncbi:hypothetical protein GCM10023114_17420 [Mycolicibacterium sediminis]|uniref:Uncharacterized protein n=1 Tax=Mycolicibacterium sediminis TaxID=1286180 RepID=A0A7I7QQR4_9MYCO|nr:hypothetical protein MSEDJ_28250 [Mycolicibacterium sediminis]